MSLAAVFLQGKEVMSAFIDELKKEGVTYVPPWRPPLPQIDDQDAIITAAAATELESSAPANDTDLPADGAVGMNPEEMAANSSDFGSMSLEEVSRMERACELY